MLVFLFAALLIGILAAVVWKAVLCFSLLFFSLSQDGFTQISLAWRQKTYCPEGSQFSATEGKNRAVDPEG